MTRTFPVVILTAVCCLNAAAETRKMQLLNPDGTPAVDAKAVAVSATGVAILDKDLNQWHPDAPQFQGRPAAFEVLVNDQGTVSFDDSVQAVVAQNDNGFVFIPVEAFAASRKLHPWAIVQLDTSTMPVEYRQRLRRNFVWTNNFSASTIVGRTAGQEDSKVDWRFSLITAIHQDREVRDGVVRVPPGEVMIEVNASSKDLLPAGAQALSPPQGVAMQLGPWATVSGAVTDIALPAFGSVEGTFVSDEVRPNWGKSVDDVERVSIRSWRFADPPATDFLRFAREEVTAKNEEPRNRYAKFLASASGRAQRQLTLRGQSVATDSSGNFRFDLVPVGQYSLMKMVPHEPPTTDTASSKPAKSQGRAFSAAAVFSVGTNPRSLVSFDVVAGETTMVGAVESGKSEQDPFGTSDDWEPRRRTGSPTQNVSPSSQIASSQIRQERSQVPSTNPFGRRQPPPPAQKGTSRFPTKPDAFLSNRSTMTPSSDGRASALIEDWLRTNNTTENRAELEKLLQKHLESEFDSSQQSRRSEIERLEQLISKSKEWIDQRQQRRDEIVRQRILELLQSIKKPKKR